MKGRHSSSSSESYFRAQYESVCKERDVLLGTIEAQERDIDDLKKSVYELSYMLSMQGSANIAAGGVASPRFTNGVGAGLRPSGRAVFDPRVGMTAGHLDSLNFINEAGIEIGGGSGVATDRVLVAEAKLSGHTAAVYVAKFSPRDSLVASAGFDRTLRLWEGTYPYSQVACLERHRQLISDVCWAPDGRSLISASFDQTVAKWDTETGQPVGGMLALEGLVQCIQMAAEGGTEGSMSDSISASSSGNGGLGGGGGGGGALGTGRVAYAGSTSKRIYTVDTRDPMSVVAKWDCGSFVNSLHVYSDGSKVVSADADGNILTWDARTGGVVDSYTLEDPIHISHVQASPPDAGRQDEEGLLLAANCFDNTLRVFHRRFHNDFSQRTFDATTASGASTSASSLLSGDTVGGVGGETGAGGAKEPSLQLMYALRGHTVKNWPIRCAFFRGLHHRPPRVRLGLAKGGDHHWGGNGGMGAAGGSGMIGSSGVGRGVLGAGGSTGGGINGSRCTSDVGGKGGKGGGVMGYSDLGKDWQHSLVLATGSADGSIHLFDLSNGQGDEMQTLRGHRDRVYSVDFHPTEPKLVSCSADRTVRIWLPTRKRYTRK